MSGEADIDEGTIRKLRDLGGDAFAAEMIELFFGYVPKKIEEAKAGWGEGNLRAVEQAVHPVKSSAGNVGAVVVRDLAARIEKLSREGETGALPDLLRDLEAAFASARALLDERRKELGRPG